ncbi:MAG TPA: diaminopimelate decarboxylase, partial [Spirochaetia bacterium]
MTVKRLPCSGEKLREIVRSYPTPFHIYDEKAIRDNARALTAAFAWAPGFREHFAVKACPNPHIVKITKEEGFGTDCSSMAELLLSERLGITGELIMFTSNDTPSS